ncbi:restriction endonuclease [Mycoplasma wenyonii str. Massachusetts]|uniref:Restriction endonuclease n=1 Tax=Mycoplasma wenyonii (strain Massachusetts) TaxID=1197325 RepID=I6YM20_MYCWM|nr:restriction endonuclease [Mycoplasma wenyonii]AFN65339.1 restriction endonuclease [Mycoplasma wenyonii str. Massachusetts]
MLVIVDPLINPWSGESQSWYDVKLTVQGEHNLPTEKEWFYVVTEGGNHFKARFFGKKTKKLISFEDARILGQEAKGAMVEREMAYQVYDTEDDPERKVVITKEDLEACGGSEVILKKTNMTKEDIRGNKRDIWILSFPYKLWEPDEELYKWVTEIANK